MADSSPERRFTRIDRLPPYVFNITAELKMAARRRGEDIIDFSMGNPDGATPPHIVEKLCTVAQRPDTHGYSTSRGIPRLRRAISRWYQDPPIPGLFTVENSNAPPHSAQVRYRDNMFPRLRSGKLSGSVQNAAFATRTGEDSSKVFR
jgi:hypothetical protein